MKTTITPKKLTGVALELAAGRMRHPDLSELHRQWLAEESGEADETPNPSKAIMEPTWTESQLKRRQLAEQGVAVVANLSADKALVEWAKAEGLFTRVDRRSPWGNPFVLRSEADRDDVCNRYAEHLKTRRGLLESVPLLRGCVLGCWCYPKRCHGDHLAALANGESSSGPARQQELFS